MIEMLNGLGFIRGTAAFSRSGLELAASDRDRLERELMTPGAVIEGRAFRFRDRLPLRIIGVRNLTINRCRFIWDERPACGYWVYASADAGVTISNCHFLSIEAA